MLNSIAPIIKLTQIEQICIVVKNLEKSIKSLSGKFGIGPWDEIIVREPKDMTDMLYHGKPAEISFKYSRSGKIGGVEIELIQPLSDDTCYMDFLKEHGEGIHHLGFYRCGNPQEWVDIKRRLEDAGYPCLMSAKGKIGGFAYFDTNEGLYTVIEVVYRNVAT